MIKQIKRLVVEPLASGVRAARRFSNSFPRATQTGVSADLRRTRAERRLEVREKDRLTFEGKDAGAHYTDRGPALFYHDFHVDPHQEITGMLAALPAGEKLEVLEFSAGQGKLSGSIREAFGGRVSVTATGLARPPKVPEGVVYRVGTFRWLAQKFVAKKKKFHFVACLQGETRLMPPAEAAAILDRLVAPHGRACIQFLLQRGSEPAAVLTPFAAHGFETASARYLPMPTADATLMSLYVKRAQ